MILVIAAELSARMARQIQNNLGRVFETGYKPVLRFFATLGSTLVANGHPYLYQLRRVFSFRARLAHRHFQLIDALLDNRWLESEVDPPVRVDGTMGTVANLLAIEADNKTQTLGIRIKLDSQRH